jgi:hypothetical protein
MSKDIIVQFVGFESKAKVREYTFTVREASAELRDYTLTIPHEAFNEHRLRFQEAPDVCSLKLRRELAANSNHLAETRLQVTDADLEDYRAAHAPRAAKSRLGHKPVQDF